MKTCPKCQQAKPLTEYYPTAKEGKLSSYCKPCCKDQQRSWTIANRQRKRDINKAWRERNPERRKLINSATNALWKAIRAGVIVRGVSCESCGGSCRVEAAHYDYSKPLDVLWLCQSCHRTWDCQSPKSTVEH